MYYKARSDLPLAWSFQDLLKLPIFMKEEIYSVLDEIAKERDKQMGSLVNGLNPLEQLF
jgi:hypothetical protein